MRKLIDGAVAVALFTAFLFALGIANYNGYLTGLGVETDFISRSSHQILYSSLFVILTPLVRFLVWAVFLIIMLRLAVTLYTEVAISFYKVRKVLVKCRKAWPFFRTRSKSEVWADKVLVRLHIVPLVVVFSLIFSALLHAEKEGKRYAGEKVLKLKEKLYDPHEVVRVDGIDGDIYVVSCGINNCAAITVDNMEVIYFENKFSAGQIKNAAKGLQRGPEVESLSTEEDQGLSLTGRSSTSTPVATAVIRQTGHLK